jgi:cyclomaltodextrinase / maltogenic alpha-amylase / neopullulanase
MAVPFWVQDAVFYQIFPDRFANGDTTSDPPNMQPWGSPPTLWDFQGGDLRGIIQKIDYLLDLGVNALYLNPIFQAPSTHRYNTTDYTRIDPKLGTLADFRALLDVAHQNNIRVILDGVFNHCGRGFFAFTDLLENQEKSPYQDWFHVLHFPVDAYTPGEARDYLAWWKIKSLPKFNTDNAHVRDYIFGVARYWIEQGIDGWRLDVPNEIDDDSFWQEFRRTVRAINPEAYLVGEIWDPAPRWANDTHFDGLMNYPLRTALLGYLGKTIPASEFGERLDKLFSAYPRANTYAMLQMLGTHDTERILTLLEGDLNKLLLASLFLFAIPGAPSVYYGDEIGLEGGKDPDNRRAFPWDPADWKPGVFEFTQQLISLRKRLPALRRGSYLKLFNDDPRGIFAFARTLSDEKVVVVMNSSGTRRSLHVPVTGLGWAEGHIVQNLLGPGEYYVANGSLSLALDAWSGIWLK